MKKSSFIAIFILFVIATVLIIIGSFGKSPKEIAEDSDVVIAGTLKPIGTENPNATTDPNATASPDGTADPSETSEPSETAAPVEFPKIRNAEFVKYDNTFDNFSSHFTEKTDTDVAKSVIYKYCLEKLSDIDYVFYQNEESTESWDVCLTFSLHLEYGYTEKILDLLKDHDIKAVFFVSYQYITENPEIVKRMVEEGHVVGNRGTYVNESDIKSATAEEFAESLLKVEEEYQKLFGADKRMYLFRTDYFSNRTLQVAQALGYTVVFRTYNYYQTFSIYGENISAEDLAKRFNERGLYKGSVDEFSCEKKIYDAFLTFLEYAEDTEISFKLVERKIFLE